MAGPNDLFSFADAPTTRDAHAVRVPDPAAAMPAERFPNNEFLGLDLAPMCDAFNARCPIGTRGKLRFDNGQIFDVAVIAAARVEHGNVLATFQGNADISYFTTRFTPEDGQ